MCTGTQRKLFWKDTEKMYEQWFTPTRGTGGAGRQFSFYTFSTI